MEQLNCVVEANRVLDEFRRKAGIQRQSIITHFATFLETVNSNQRAVIAEFDLNVQLVIKVLETQATVTEIGARQLLGRVQAFQGTETGLGKALQQPKHGFLPTPVKSFAGVQMVREIVRIGRCLAYIPENDVVDAHPVVEEESNLDVGAQLSNLFEDMHQSLQECKDAVTRTLCCTHTQKHIEPVFAGRSIKMTVMSSVADSSIGGIAVSPDGNILAISNILDSVIHVISVSTGKPIREIEKRGILKTPRNLRFAAGNSTIIVSNSGEWRLHEFTITGNHVRAIGDNIPGVLLSSFDVKKDVIVACALHSSRICVIDYLTGLVSRTIGNDDVGTECKAVGLLPDGKHVVVAYTYYCIVVWNLDGNFVKRFHLDCSHPLDLQVFQNGQIMVNGLVGGNFGASLYSPEGEVIVRALCRSRDENGGGTYNNIWAQMCVANNFVFVYQSKMLELLW